MNEIGRVADEGQHLCECLLIIVFFFQIWNEPSMLRWGRFMWCGVKSLISAKLGYRRHPRLDALKTRVSNRFFSRFKNSSGANGSRRLKSSLVRLQHFFQSRWVLSAAHGWHIFHLVIRISFASVWLLFTIGFLFSATPVFSSKFYAVASDSLWSSYVFILYILRASFREIWSLRSQSRWQSLFKGTPSLAWGQGSSGARLFQGAIGLFC